MFRTWKKLALDTTMLAWEVPQVIALRLLKLARGGPAASHEAKRWRPQSSRPGAQRAP